MGLSRLNNFLKNPKGEIIYVDPSHLDATDSIENQGNSLTRPFKTIQRALIEAARFSYQRGESNDRFEKTTVVVYPGEHLIDNRPGYITTHDAPVSGNNFLTRGGTATNNFAQFDLNTNFDIESDDNQLHKLNSVYGGVIVPRGCSLVGMDLRKTKIRPKYVPNPENSQIENSAIFRVTGACYFWQFTIFDANPNGFVYKDYTSNRFIPNFSHHKLTAFEYADGVNPVVINDDFLTYNTNKSVTRTDLDMYYDKIGLAFGPSSGREVTNDFPSADIDIQPKIDEYRIVGSTGETVGITSIKSGDGVTSSTDITVTLGDSSLVVQVDSPIRIQGVSAAGYNGQFVVSEVLSSTQIKYRVQNAPADPLPNVLTGGASVSAIVDTVSSASPYIFNISLRSVFGMCGLHADGNKATGFKSMVVAQFTGIGLQKDSNAFIKYDSISGTYLDRTASGNDNIGSDSRATFKPTYQNYHIKASNDAILQLVSIFAIGYSQHFVAESGGDLSITNSNSNFGAKALIASGFKKDAFLKDDIGYITHIIPPRELETPNITVECYPIDVGVTTARGILAGAASTTRLYLYNETSRDLPPSNVIEGYRFGAKQDETYNVRLVTLNSQEQVSVPVIMENTDSGTGEAVGKKSYVVALNADGTNNISNNILSFTAVHALKTGETIRILSNSAQLPDGLFSNQLYYAIASDIDTNLNPNQIKIAQTANEAVNNSEINLNSRGGLLTVESRVSDKKPGDLGHPIQWDSNIEQWYVNVSDDPSKNIIYEKLLQYGENLLGNSTPKGYIYRRPDNRSLSDLIYRLRFVIPKDSPIKARPPLDGYVLQESSSTIPSTNTEIAKYFSSSYNTLTNSTELRNPKFIAFAQWQSHPIFGGIATIVCELPHQLSLGSYVEIRNIVSTNNLTAKYESGYNGYFQVVNLFDRKIFQVILPLDPGTFASNTAVRNTSLPYFVRKKYYNTFSIYKTEEIQEYIQGEKDGIYHLVAYHVSNNPTVAPFDTLRFAQPIQNLYPQTNRDNPKSDANPSVSHAVAEPIGQVVIDNPEHSITKEALGRGLYDFGIGVGVTDIASDFNSFTISDTDHTIYTKLDHGLNRITGLSVLSPGYNYGFGVSGTLYNATLVGIAGTVGGKATAAINVNNSGEITGISVMDGGSAYQVGDQLAVVGVVTAAGTGLGIHTVGVVVVTSIYDNVGDTFSIQGIFPPVYDGYNNLYEVTEVVHGKTNEFRVRSSTQVAAATSTGIGATFTSRSVISNNGPTVDVSEFTYNHVTGIATVVSPNNHGLYLDNKIRFGGFDQSVFNGDFIIKKINNLKSFNVNIGVSTVAISTSGSPKIYRSGFGANGGVLSKENERISSRLVTEYAGITTVIGASIVDAITDTLVIENVEKFDFKIGDFLVVDDEIFRIKTTPGIGVTITNPVSVYRGLFGSSRQTHIIGSTIQKIQPRPIELRRNSIIRASGHTFEYVGFGPGNYSTALPSRQDRQLSPAEEIIAQSFKIDGGINVFTGMNNDGDFYIGNKRVSSATGQQEVYDAPIPTVTGEELSNNTSGVNIGFDILTPLEININRAIRVEGGADQNVISEFDGPVIFNNVIVSNSEDGIKIKSVSLKGDTETSQKLSVGISTPTFAGDYGDITFTDNPRSGEYLGWVYTINNRWERFGPIQTLDASEGTPGRYVGIWSGMGLNVPSFFGDGSGLYNVSDIWKSDAIGIHTDRFVGIGTDSAKPGVILFVDGDVEFTGVTTISNTTQSHNKDTGALVVEGGVGIEKNLNVGGDFKVTGISTFIGGVDFVNLTVSNQATINNLYVSGVSTFVGFSTFNSYVVVDDGFRVSGITTVQAGRFYYGRQELRTVISGFTIVFGL